MSDDRLDIAMNDPVTIAEPLQPLMLRPVPVPTQ
jgi:hypothetical protein